MTDAYYQAHAKSIARITKALPASAPALLKAFTHAFFAKVHISDLERFNPAHAVAIATSAFRFFEQRKPGAPAIRLFSPTRKEHGYETVATIIELINDDMPFLVDSLTAELGRQGFTIRETVHPILYVQRDKAGKLLKVSATPDSSALKPESFIHFEISPLPQSVSGEQLKTDLEWVLEYISCAVADWQQVTERASAHIASIANNRQFFDSEAIAEAQSFMRWLIDRNFVFLGYAEYDFFDAKGREKLSAVNGSKLGVLKISSDTTFRGLESLSPELRHLVLVPQLIEITKTMRRSPVHRPVPMDCIGIKRFNNKGEVIGEARFVGLFTSNVYYQSTESIPLLRHKIARILGRADFKPTSHDGKALKAILEFYPRDETFQTSEDQLLETSLGILALESRPSVRIFLRPDAFERFVSVMVFVPRERFSTDLRHEIQQILEQAFDGSTSTFTTQITEAQLARLHLIIKTKQGSIPAANIARLEAEIARRAYLWSDLLLEELQRQHGEKHAATLHRIYANAFSKDYINHYSCVSAVHDISKIEAAQKSGTLALELYTARGETNPRFLHLKIYSPGTEIAISDIIPIMENAGFRVIEELPYHITPDAAAPVWLRDFKLELPEGLSIDVSSVKPLLEEALLAVWNREAENDRFNALVLKSELSAHDVLVLRAYAKYLKQIGFPYEQAAIEQAMNQQPHIARQIVALFAARFHPAQKNRDAEQTKLRSAIEENLTQVSSVSEDRILRRFAEVIMATLRTNYYQTLPDGRAKPVLSFKFHSASVPELPLPKPYAEIFVYGTRVEGIHLRGGKVARGGLRWSDRLEDFRTEVLGLMKAQMVKNSVIVPVGSKGGFVVKQPPASRDAFMEEGIACYKMYLSGLLDLTDNIVSGKVTPPAQLVRHDGDDPYLVVAADKGTASFSDIANSISAEYGFWLGDAFASGGSAGYDHKKMAITARGAWVSVERHFREMGVDISKEEFTVVGIGDMSGDVFGNGMLLSKNIKLLAAFNHMHIVLDPTPDAARSYKERERLFKLPRSTWKDYDASLISKGGGIYERSAKSIPVSKEAQAALGLTKSAYTPEELIRALLQAPVDLLWNGGIGTYVKAEDETHDNVGDRTNNAVRVNGRDLRCKLVGEGGNLGFTQKGRIEYAKNGGRINTDAIDNSAGVDCSDHEVNIKIAFSGEMARTKLTLAKRDKLLVDMTDEVARLVLKDNILQTQALTIAQGQGVGLIESHQRLMHGLERAGLLDRTIEFLPTDKQITELKAAGKGLTRPELAVLLAYSKMHLYSELLASSLPDEAYYTADLARYFPRPMQEQFSQAINLHPLRREIIATVVTNSIINRTGITFFSDIAADLGAPARDIAAAYTLARDMFAVRDWWKAIEAASASTATQVDMYAATSRFLEGVTRWILRNLPLPLDIERAAQEIQPGIIELQKQADKLHSPQTLAAATARRQQLLEQGVPAPLAEKMAQLEILSSAFDIIAVSHRTGLTVTQVGKLYFALGERLSLAGLRQAASRLQPANGWERLAIQAIIGDLYDEQRRLALTLIEGGQSLEAWAGSHQDSLARFDQLLADIGTGTADIPRLMVVLRQLRGLD